MDQRPRAPRVLIEAYGAGGFRIAGERHDGAILVAGTRAWSLGDAGPGSITIDSLAPAFVEMPDTAIVLLGTGKGMLPPPAGLASALRARGAVLETMATGAACRTYNVLSGEGRLVAALLLAV